MGQPTVAAARLAARLLLVASAAAAGCWHGSCGPGNEQCGPADPPAASGSQPGAPLSLVVTLLSVAVPTATCC